MFSFILGPWEDVKEWIIKHEQALWKQLQEVLSADGDPVKAEEPCMHLLLFMVCLSAVDKRASQLPLYYLNVRPLLIDLMTYIWKVLVKNTEMSCDEIKLLSKSETFEAFMHEFCGVFNETFFSKLGTLLTSFWGYFSSKRASLRNHKQK